MNQNPDLSIVIVNYNTKDYTAQCIDSIYSHQPDTSFEIVLVDNASQDNSADWLESRYTQVKLIRSTKNRGIAGGNNMGIQASAGRYILLLNNDTVVLPGMLDRMVRFLDTHLDTGAVGSRLINPDGSFQANYGDFPTLWSEFLNVTRLGILFNPHFPSHPDCAEVRDADWIGSASLAIRRSALEQIGPVDERYFIYSDETDLQYRLKHKGWKIYFDPEIVTIHYGGKSMDRWRRRKLVYRGSLLFFRKNYGRTKALLLRIIYLGAGCIKLTIWFIASFFPHWNDQAKKELASNIDILRLCIKTGYEEIS